MKNVIQQEFMKHELPAFAIYQTPSEEIEVLTSGYNIDTYNMMVFILNHDEELYDFLDQAMDAAYLLKYPSP